jgi:hypothetical protein
MTIRAEILAQCLAVHFEDDEGWEWNQVADWLVEEFLPIEHRLGRVKDLLGIEGAAYVTWDEPFDPKLDLLLDGLGLRLEIRQISRHHSEQVLVKA